jgi:arginine deiminase
MASQENVRQSEALFSRLSEDAVERNRKFQQWNDTMAARLEELRNKITQARHAANGVCTEHVLITVFTGTLITHWECCSHT